MKKKKEEKRNNVVWRAKLGLGVCVQNTQKRQRGKRGKRGKSCVPTPAQPPLRFPKREALMALKGSRHPDTKSHPAEHPKSFFPCVHHKLQNCLCPWHTMLLQYQHSFCGFAHLGPALFLALCATANAANFSGYFWEILQNCLKKHLFLRDKA